MGVGVGIGGGGTGACKGWGFHTPQDRVAKGVLLGVGGGGWFVIGIMSAGWWG